MEGFIALSVLKSDELSQTEKGHLAGAPRRAVVFRRLSGLPWWARPVARRLCRREARALVAARGIAGVPTLLRLDRDGLLRSWTEGEPLHLARPDDPAFYRDARRLLRDLRRVGITHNDAAKPQNWLRRPDGGAALIDFQLAVVHRRRGWTFRMMAYEDLRHLLKQKRAFAGAGMTAGERRLAERRSAVGRLWRGAFKPLYHAVTRGLLRWSDSEGLGGRLERDGPATEAALLAQPGVRAVALVSYPRAGRRAGLCAVCEGGAELDPGALARAQRDRGGAADLVLVEPALPRDPDGALRQDRLRRLVMDHLDR